MHASSGFRTHDPNVSASEVSSCLRPRDDCHRLYDRAVCVNYASYFMLLWIMDFSSIEGFQIGGILKFKISMKIFGYGGENLEYCSEFWKIMKGSNFMSDWWSKNFGKVNSWTAATWNGHKLLHFYKKHFLNFYSKSIFRTSVTTWRPVLNWYYTQPTGHPYSSVERNITQEAEDATCNSVGVLRTRNTQWNILYRDGGTC
jgi:hypothetical protein